MPNQTKAQSLQDAIQFDFYGEHIQIPYNSSMYVRYAEPLTEKSLQQFYRNISTATYTPLLTTLKDYKTQLQLDDWLFYQLIRKTAEKISPKQINYHEYTLYKWYLLSQCGYDATLKTNGNKLLFYVQSNDNIYNVPYYLKDGKQYVCLNYHDYGANINFEEEQFNTEALSNTTKCKSFTYKVTRLPGFHPQDYNEKDLKFVYNESNYNFKIKLNTQVKNIFANYPVVDYESYFNIPMSNETYASLIPLLKKNLHGLNTKNGVDYLIHFTRYAFLFQKDEEVFGQEKRFSPEQTLLYEQSDCEDRVALLFFLVKEIYNLPMIVVTFPEHVTLAVKFDKPIGKPIIYNGEKYTVCEPTPQKQELNMGQLMPQLKGTDYEVVYNYKPSGK